MKRKGKKMADFIAYYKEHWYYLIVLVVALALLVFVFRKARKAYRNYYSHYRKEEAEIKHLNELKARFSEISADDLKNEKDDDLLEGVALTYQLELQKKDNMEKAFSEYPLERQYVYALDIFTQSSSATDFFRENGRELTEIVVPALKSIDLPGDADEAEKLRIMFDDTDETTSINNNTIDGVNAYFASEGKMSEIKLAAAKMIKKQPEIYILQPKC